MKKKFVEKRCKEREGIDQEIIDTLKAITLVTERILKMLHQKKAGNKNEEKF